MEGYPYIPSYTPLESQYKVMKTYHADVLYYLDLADLWLQPFNAHPQNNYNKVLNEHIRMSISTYATAMEAIKNGYVHPLASERRNWLAVSMHEYWAALPGLSKRVAARSTCDPQQVTDAWITMIFRAFCWHHSHRLVPTRTVLPSEWHGSKMPVYIG